MQTFVTGGSGFVGRTLIRVLREKGHQVRALARSDAAMETVLFRIVQEAINNAARHSGAQMCRLTLSNTNSTLRAVVEDDGRGFYTDVDAEGTNHYGLKGMKERVDIIGGKLKLTSKPGSGSKVEVRVSYREGYGGKNSHRDS